MNNMLEKSKGLQRYDEMEALCRRTIKDLKLALHNEGFQGLIPLLQGHYHIPSYAKSKGIIGKRYTKKIQNFLDRNGIIFEDLRPFLCPFGLAIAKLNKVYAEHQYPGVHQLVKKAGSVPKLAKKWGVEKKQINSFKSIVKRIKNKTEKIQTEPRIQSASKEKTDFDLLKAELDNLFQKGGTKALYQFIHNNSQSLREFCVNHGFEQEFNSIQSRLTKYDKEEKRIKFKEFIIQKQPELEAAMEALEITTNPQMIDSTAKRPCFFRSADPIDTSKKIKCEQATSINKKSVAFNIELDTRIIKNEEMDEQTLSIKSHQNVSTALVNSYQPRTLKNKIRAYQIFKQRQQDIGFFGSAPSENLNLSLTNNKQEEVPDFIPPQAS